MLRSLPHGMPRRGNLYGPAGTGKTTYWFSLTSDAERITLTQAMFPDALYGKFLLRDGSTVWVDGAATRAARRGVPLILDEIHKASPELESTLQAILDDESVCRLNLDNGECVTPKKGFAVYATQNGTPDLLAEAVRDRFDFHLNCRTPHTGILKRLSAAGAAYIKNKMENDPEVEQFIPKQSTAKTCSNKCRQALHRRRHK